MPYIVKQPYGREEEESSQANKALWVNGLQSAVMVIRGQEAEGP